MSAMNPNHGKKPVCAVLGVGPGLGASVAKRFARAGYAVAMMARTADRLNTFKEDIEKEGGVALGVPTDASNEQSIRTAFAEIRSKLGDVDVLCFNAGSFARGGILDIKPSQMADLFSLTVLGCMTSSQEVLPGMLAKKKGTILITGATASLRGGAGFSGLAVPKFALRALAQSMAREFAPQGVHVAHIIVDGQINTPRQVAMQPDRPLGSFLDSDVLAEQYFQLHSQPSTVWTHELDVRPNVEKW